MHVLDNISTQGPYGSDGDFPSFANALWHYFYKLPIDTISKYPVDVIRFIRDRFFGDDWYKKYDLIEYLAGMRLQGVNNGEYINEINETLKREFSGYRFINGQISSISNTIEVEEIERAIAQGKAFTSLNGANIHLTNALDKLSDRNNPDYRNSIKESISAVETTSRILTGENTLGKALNALESKGIIIDEQFKSAFEKIYAGTNNKQSGIRHAIIEEHKKPDFHDAKFMLVVCSSFINFLVGKSKTLVK